MSGSSTWLGGQRVLQAFVIVWASLLVSGAQEGLPVLPDNWDVSAIIIDLKFKGLPIVADPDDPDPKDTSVTRAKLDTPAFGNTKRLLMRAKKDGAAHSMSYQRSFSDDFEGEIVISVDPDAGTLVDGQSAGFLEVRQDPDFAAEGVPVFLRMTATWDSSAQGLAISAEDHTGPLGTPLSFPGSMEVILRMTWTDTLRSLNASPLDAFQEGYVQFFHDDKVAVPAGVPFFMGFGVEALGKAARFYFINLGITSSKLSSGGGEVKAAAYASAALSFIELAWVYALDDFPTAWVKSNLDIGTQLLEMAMDELEMATDAGTVDDSAEVKLARRSLKKGMKRLTKGGKLADKLLKKEKSPTNSLANKCNKARWQALLIRAQLFGFKSKSIDHYFDTLIVDVPTVF